MKGQTIKLLRLSLSDHHLCSFHSWACKDFQKEGKEQQAQEAVQGQKQEKEKEQ